VRNWKDCRLANLKFASFSRNLAWVSATFVVGALLVRAQMTCLDGEFQEAEPQTLRFRILHVATMLARRGRQLVLLKGASTGFCVRALPRSPDVQPLPSYKYALFTVEAETHRERRHRSRVAGE
jgi:hypothetical protein